MIDIRIVCTHDALKTAETLMRLLDAEEHRTRLSYGRQSLLDLEISKSAGEAVLLIWSHEAPSALYMHEWARGIEPSRLAEIARAPGWPRLPQHAPVIDFSTWRGERGGRAWHALNERLKVITRTLEPPKPAPTRAVLALSLASVAAVAGALIVRVNDAHMTPETETFAENEPLIMSVDAAQGVGGPIDAIEPASLEDIDAIRFRAGPRATTLPPLGETRYVPVRDYEPVELRDPTLMERLSALNPLRDDDESETP
ncbi:MAG: hypothetical protein R3C16_08545 [Hyphomonadaceae bacterium]